MRRRPVPPGPPRYGLLLEVGNRAVGVLLIIRAEVGAAGRRHLRCNLSSRLTEPAYAACAPLVLSAALKRTDVTFLNISPAPPTEAVVEARGFRASCRGSLLIVPLLSGLTDRRRARPLPPEAALPEGDLAEAHLAPGCLCLGMGQGDNRLPFILSPPRSGEPAPVLPRPRRLCRLRRSARPRLGTASPECWLTRPGRFPPCPVGASMRRRDVTGAARTRRAPATSPIPNSRSSAIFKD